MAPHPTRKGDLKLSFVSGSVAIDAHISWLRLNVLNRGTGKPRSAKKAKKKAA